MVPTKSLVYRQDVNRHRWQLLTGRVDATDTCAGRAPSWGCGSCRLCEQSKIKTLKERLPSLKLPIFCEILAHPALCCM